MAQSRALILIILVATLLVVAVGPAYAVSDVNPEIANCEELKDQATIEQVNFCRTHVFCAMVMKLQTACTKAKTFLSKLKSMSFGKSQRDSGDVFDAAAPSTEEDAAFNIISGAIKRKYDRQPKKEILTGQDNLGGKDVKWVYEGVVREGQRDGSGVMASEAGWIVRGDFVQGRVLGQADSVSFHKTLGEFRLAGEMVDDKLEGQGILRAPKVRMEGKFRLGHLEEGVSESDFMRQEGKFKLGGRLIEGTQIFKNGPVAGTRQTIVDSKVVLSVPPSAPLAPVNTPASTPVTSPTRAPQPTAPTSLAGTRQTPDGLRTGNPTYPKNPIVTPSSGQMDCTREFEEAKRLGLKVGWEWWLKQSLATMADMVRNEAIDGGDLRSVSQYCDQCAKWGALPQSGRKPESLNHREVLLAYAEAQDVYLRRKTEFQKRYFGDYDPLKEEATWAKDRLKGCIARKLAGQTSVAKVLDHSSAEDRGKTSPTESLDHNPLHDASNCIKLYGPAERKALKRPGVLPSEIENTCPFPIEVRWCIESTAKRRGDCNPGYSNAISLGVRGGSGTSTYGVDAVNQTVHFAACKKGERWGFQPLKVDPRKPFHYACK